LMQSDRFCFYFS